MPIALSAVRVRTVVSQTTIPAANGISTYIEEGARIAAILLVWGVLAAFFVYGVGEIGYPGSFLSTIGTHIGGVLALTGVLNAVLYLLYRAIDYWQYF